METKTVIDPTFRLIGKEADDTSEKYKKYREKWENNPKNRIVEKSPIHLDLELTSGCNLRCPMCFQTDEKTRPEQGGYMSEELFKKIIDEATPNGLCSIKLQFRGEPLMHPKIIELVGYAKQKGVVEIMFNSNMTLMTSDKALGFVKNNMDKIICSVDGYTKDVYESIRIGANNYINKFENVMRNIIQVQVIKMSNAFKNSLTEKHSKEVNQKIIDEYLKLCTTLLEKLKDRKNADLKKDMPEDTHSEYQKIYNELETIKNSYLNREIKWEEFLYKYSPKFLELLAFGVPYLSKHVDEYVSVLKELPHLKTFYLQKLLENEALKPEFIEQIKSNYAGFGGSGKDPIKPLLRTQMVDILPDPHNPKLSSNHHEIPEYLEFWSKIVEHVAVEDENDWFIYKPDTRVGAWTCPQLWQRMIILYDGSTRPCCGDHEGHMNIGNAKNETIENMWTANEKLKHWRKLHEEGKSHLIKGCLHCGIRKTEFNRLEKKGELIQIKQAA